MNIDFRNRNLEEEDRLVRENVRLAYHFVHKLHLSNKDDAVDIALEGLWKAAVTYDASKGIKFGTYASVCIYNALGMYIRKMKRLGGHEVRSVDEHIFENLTLADTISDENANNPETLCVASECNEDLHVAIHKVINQASTDKHREVIEMWYRSGATMTQADIAKATGFSQSFVSRILSMAKHKIRLELEELR